MVLILKFTKCQCLNGKEYGLSDIKKKRVKFFVKKFEVRVFNMSLFERKRVRFFRLLLHDFYQNIYCMSLFELKTLQRVAFWIERNQCFRFCFKNLQRVIFWTEFFLSCQLLTQNFTNWLLRIDRFCIEGKCNSSDM